MRQIATFVGALAFVCADTFAIAGIARATSQTWTIHGEVESATDANGNTTAYVYDSLGRRTTTTRAEVDGAFATTQIGYDLVGNVISSTDARGHVTSFTVDALNRRTDQSDPADGEGVVYSQHWTVDQAGNAVRHTDRRGIESTTRFDKENRVLGTSRAGLTLSTLVRDADGNVRTATDALGRITTTTLDKASRKTLEERPGATESWTWTAENNLATHTDADGRIEHSDYDLRRQLTAQTNNAGETTDYSYDGIGNRLSTQCPFG